MDDRNVRAETSRLEQWIKHNQVKLIEVRSSFKDAAASASMELETKVTARMMSQTARRIKAVWCGRQSKLSDRTCLGYREWDRIIGWVRRNEKKVDELDRHPVLCALLAKRDGISFSSADTMDQALGWCGMRCEVLHA